MDDLEKMQAIVDECDEIKSLIKANGELGLDLAAALFRVAYREDEETNSKISAMTFIKLLEKGAGKSCSLSK